MTSAKYFDAFSLVVTLSHSWSLVVTRVYFRPDPFHLIEINFAYPNLLCTSRSHSYVV